MAFENIDRSNKRLTKDLASALAERTGGRSQLLKKMASASYPLSKKEKKDLVSILADMSLPKVFLVQNAEQKEVSQITAVADVASSLDGTAIELGDASYIWFDVAAGGNDPAIADKTGIAVSIAADDGDTVVAAAIQAAVDGDAGFSASVDGAVVTVTDAGSGDKVDIADVDSGMAVAVVNQGKAVQINARKFVGQLTSKIADGDIDQLTAKEQELLKTALGDRTGDLVSRLVAKEDFYELERQSFQV